MKPASPRLWFTDFWHAETPQAIKQHNPFYHILARAFDVRLDKNKPEFLLYGSFGYRFWAYDGRRIFCSGEADAPDFANCDWAFSCDVRSHHGRNIYTPPWATWDTSSLPETAIQRPKWDGAELTRRKKHFCVFVQRNPKCQLRNEFFRILSAKKFVHAAGPLFNNHPIPVSRTAEDHYRALPDFYAQFKFVIAFEHVSVRGYGSEKLMLPLLGWALPIYWGDPQAQQYFHEGCFLRAQDFASLEALADHVLALDKDDARYLAHLNAPLFVDNKLPPCADWDWLAQRFADIFAAPVPPIARRRHWQKHVLRHLPQRGAMRQLHRRYRKWQQARYQRAHGTHALIPDDSSSHDHAA